MKNRNERVLGLGAAPQSLYCLHLLRGDVQWTAGEFLRSSDVEWGQASQKLVLNRVEVRARHG